jgi:hypothetical protein
MLSYCEEYSGTAPLLPNASGGKERFLIAQEFLNTLQDEHGVASRNQIKLGIGETVRVLLRRLPKVVLLSPDAREKDAELIRRLAGHRNVSVQARIMPFAGVALIANVAVS